MYQETIAKGNHVVHITGDTLNEDGEEFSIYNSRLYVNDGDTATDISAEAKTLNGARKQAQKMLNGWIPSR